MQKRAERNAFDTERLADQLLRRISEMLMLLPEGDPREQEMTSLYHRGLDLFRRYEAASELVLAARRSDTNTNGSRLAYPQPAKRN